MKKILLSCTHAGFGGVAKYVIDLAEMLSTSKQYEVFIAVGNDHNELLPKMQERAKRVFLVRNLKRNLNPLRDFLAYLEIKELLKANRFDIVHSNGPKAGFLFRRVCYELGIPNIYTHHLVVYKQFRTMLNPLYRELERMASNWCNKVITVSEAAKRELCRDRVTPCEKIEVVHNGLKNADPRYSKEEARKKMQIPSDSFVFVSVSRLSQPKDPVTTLRAFAKLKAECRWSNLFLFFRWGWTL